uniref:Uncharacterized protein n=1 Tax=Nelumbo nucifera TaxID=4432 RepID=A0A822ZKM4_NELNU|nr:TPA_asm: hypothetical protein HUJ06_001786 [Nelumbo nucifera]
MASLVLLLSEFLHPEDANPASSPYPPTSCAVAVAAASASAKKRVAGILAKKPSEARENNADMTEDLPELRVCVDLLFCLHLGKIGVLLQGELVQEIEVIWAMLCAVD